MSTNSIPQPGQPIAGSQRVDATWYRWLRDLERLANQADADISAEIEALCRKLGSPDGTIAGIPDPSAPELVGESPVSVNGTVIGLETIGNVSGGTPQAVTVDAFGRVTQRRPIEPDEIPEDFRVWLTDETGAYLTDELGNFLCAGGVELPYVRNFLGINQANPVRRFHMVGLDGSGGALPAAVFGRSEFVYENNNNAFVSFVSPATATMGFYFTQYAQATARASMLFNGAANLFQIETVGNLNLQSGTGIYTINGGNIWHAGNSAQVTAGTINGQLATWNAVAGRYDPVTAAGLVNAANDAGAAGAGVPVSGLYRNGSVLQIRVV